VARLGHFVLIPLSIAIAQMDLFASILHSKFSFIEKNYLGVVSRSS
jgi:hypothetical protein